MDFTKLYELSGALTDEQYNVEVKEKEKTADKEENDGPLNYFIMNHTCGKCKFDSTLSLIVKNSINHMQYVYEDERIGFEFNKGKTINIIVSKERSFAAAKKYKDKKVAVLDFASSTSPGGAPWRSIAQEESLCRCSTLQDCLAAAKPYYHDKHHHLGMWGTDDLIYIPSVCVFKSDERAPLVLPENERFFTDVIVSAAPHLGSSTIVDRDELKKVLKRRLEKVLQVAQKNNVDVLILGAYGCGAFHNPPDVVAEVFKELLNQYYFETVEFAVFVRKDDYKNSNYDIFNNIGEFK